MQASRLPFFCLIPWEEEKCKGVYWWICSKKMRDVSQWTGEGRRLVSKAKGKDIQPQEVSCLHAKQILLIVLGAVLGVAMHAVHALHLVFLCFAAPLMILDHNIYLRALPSTLSTFVVSLVFPKHSNCYLRMTVDNACRSASAMHTSIFFIFF